MTSINKSGISNYDYINTYLIKQLEDELKELRDKVRCLETRVKEMEVDCYYGSIKSGR